VAAVGDAAKRSILGEIRVVDLVAEQRGDAQIDETE
jgi:hypothetical protein